MNQSVVIINEMLDANFVQIKDPIDNIFLNQNKVTLDFWNKKTDNFWIHELIDNSFLNQNVVTLFKSNLRPKS